MDTDNSSAVKAWGEEGSREEEVIGVGGKGISAIFSTIKVISFKSEDCSATDVCRILEYITQLNWKEHSHPLDSVPLCFFVSDLS